MNIAELADKVANENGISKAAARGVIDSVFESIVAAVNAGDDVSLAGVGKFALKTTGERQGRNPSTGEEMTIKAQRKISFTPAKAVKDKLNG